MSSRRARLHVADVVYLGDKAQYFIADSTVDLWDRELKSAGDRRWTVTNIEVAYGIVLQAKESKRSQDPAIAWIEHHLLIRHGGKIRSSPICEVDRPCDLHHWPTGAKTFFAIQQMYLSSQEGSPQCKLNGGNRTVVSENAWD